MEAEKEAQKDTKNEDFSDFLISSKPCTKYIDGFPLPGLLPENSYRAALNYKPRSDDIFVATYPKCGTTWTQYILLLLFKQGEPPKSMTDFMWGSPYLEMMNEGACDNLPRPIAIKTHLPYHLAPRSEAAKYIHVARNPKDCCVSFFHHMKNYPIHGFNGTFDEFFEFFISGNIDYGDYFDHLLGWYEHRNDTNILFLTYEEMKEDFKGTIFKIASFIDDKLYAEPLRNDPQKLEMIAKNSSFDSMKQTFNKQVDGMFNMSKDEVAMSLMPDEFKKLFEKLSQMPNLPEKPQSQNFIRKGIIGDWRNYFSEEQNRRLEEKFDERMQDTDLANLWSKYMKKN